MSAPATDAVPEEDDPLDEMTDIDALRSLCWHLRHELAIALTLIEEVTGLSLDLLDVEAGKAGAH